MRSIKQEIMIVLKQLALIGVLAISALAQRPDLKQRFVPPDVLRSDSAKLLRVSNPPRLSPAQKMAMLKSMPDVNLGNKSKTIWNPFFRLTPRAPIAPAGYWYFNVPAVYTPHWYNDEGVAFYVSPAPTSSQMILLFSGQPNQAYAIDVTVFVNDVTRYRIVYAVDGTPVTPKDRKFEPSQPGFAHLVFDLPASTSGEYEVTISCTEMKAWWGFYSLQVGALQ